MRKSVALAVTLMACAAAMNAQFGRTFDWWTYGGDAQRSGWDKNDTKFTKEDVKNFQLVLKRTLDNQQKGTRSLLAPVVLGTLISHRGFKELAFVAGSAGNLWAIDADLDRMFWERHFDTGASKRGCPAITSEPTLTQATSLKSMLTARNAPGAKAAGAAPAARRNFAFSARPVYLLTNDGKLHRLDTSTGKDVKPPVDLLPANSTASALNVEDEIVYATNNQVCGVGSNGVWSVDLNEEPPKTASFVSNGGAFIGAGGVALGNEDSVYVQTGEGEFDPHANKWSNAVLALNSRDLKLKQYFIFPGGAAKSIGNTGPLVFAHKGHDLVVTAGRDGRIYLLDGQALGGADHKTPLFQSPPVAMAGSAQHGIWGSLASWQDQDGSAWILASVWGALNPEIKFPVTNGDVSRGSVVAFKVTEQNGKPVLTPVWVSRDLSSPEAPVVANGVVFAVSAGEFNRQLKKSHGATDLEEHAKSSSHATLYALDALTGKQIYSTGEQVDAPGSLSGLTVANGRVYFATTDNTLYAFGLPLEH